MVEIRHICSLSELFFYLLIDRNRFTYLWNTTLDVNVLDVKTGVEGLDGGLLDGFEGLHH